MNRIDKTFAALKQQGRKALVTFTMAGDPDEATTVSILEEIAGAGADVIEIGMPFTDPGADGPAIQAAGLRALKGGANLKTVLKIVQQFRSKNNVTPIVLMGYHNPLMAYGVEAFSRDSAASGVDGMIIVDIPPEESADLAPMLQQNGLALIRLITPTSDEKRLRKILNGASGFLYYVSITGVTGTKSADPAMVERHIAEVRTQTDLPVVVGFGIRTPDDARIFAAFADGVVVGSAIVQNIEKNQGDKSLPQMVGAQVKTLKSAV